MYVHEKVKNFRVGDIVKYNSVDEYGWITGLAINSVKELVFRVKWANYPDNEVLCHPAMICLVD
jgi:hypothetical protein